MYIQHCQINTAQRAPNAKSKNDPAGRRERMKSEEVNQVRSTGPVGTWNSPPLHVDYVVSSYDPGGAKDPGGGKQK